MPSTKVYTMESGNCDSKDTLYHFLPPNGPRIRTIGSPMDTSLPVRISGKAKLPDWNTCQRQTSIKSLFTKTGKAVQVKNRHLVIATLRQNARTQPRDYSVQAPVGLERIRINDKKVGDHKLRATKKQIIIYDKTK